MEEYSPMMCQYLEIKKKHENSLLFFRLGDFYEMFFEDAKIASKELDLTLTGKDCGKGTRAPMCGIPYHSCEAYIARLIAKGYKVAMCDQIDDPSVSQGLVKREVVRVITAGTLTEDSMLDASKNNFISAICLEEKAAGICFCDVSTGELHVTEIIAKDAIDKLKNELGKFSPREILIGGKIELFEPLKNFIKEKLSCNIELLDEKVFELNVANKKILNYLYLNKIPKKLQNKFYAIRSVGALFHYLDDMQKSNFNRISNINVYTDSQFMNLDLNTIRNLELIENIRSENKKGTLLGVLDKTKTAMGKRLLRNYIERPLMKIEEILMRQNAVEELVFNVILRKNFFEILIEIHDIERTMTKIVYGSANGRDLRVLAETIKNFPKLKMILKNLNSELLLEIYKNIDDLQDVFNLVDEAIIENPPVSVRDGSIIKPDFDNDLSTLSKEVNGVKMIISEIESNERKKTGISKLKISYNKIFGYFIEVSNSFKHMVPENYVRKQTLSNCERFITADLKDLETRILTAKEKILKLEFEIFEKVRQKISKELLRIEKSAKSIAILDVICSFAEVASNNYYVKPEINLGGEIILKESRHPVVEVLTKDSIFVPNDVFLDCSQNNILIITGPNMAGKSTYMRQIALIVLMAQMGSFVPAKYAKIGIVDSIFTRIGASDDLASGQSTFMIEMNEVAAILKHATKKSLLILDEIGRGTSTFDGMSIARAVIEFIADKSKLGAKTLFATHYHELTAMEKNFSGIKNFNIAVKKHGDEIVFLRRIVSGGADDSYGIEVAKLAGIPNFVIDRAKVILDELECGNFHKNASNMYEKPLTKPSKIVPEKNLNVMDAQIENFLKKLKKLDINVLTPLESMNLLFELTKLVKNKNL